MAFIGWIFLLFRMSSQSFHIYIPITKETDTNWSCAKLYPLYKSMTSTEDLNMLSVVDCNFPIYQKDRKTEKKSLRCLVHVVTFTLISILVTDYIQKRRGQALFFSFEYNLLPNLISNFYHYMDQAIGWCPSEKCQLISW